MAIKIHCVLIDDKIFCCDGSTVMPETNKELEVKEALGSSGRYKNQRTVFRKISEHSEGENHYFLVV